MTLPATIASCPFCHTALKEYDGTGDLYTCRNILVRSSDSGRASYAFRSSHYQLYFYGTKNKNGCVEYQELIVFERFALGIEHPEGEWSIRLIPEENDALAVIANIEPFNIQYNLDNLQNKLETYITFL
jgi:hypothetical protein